MSTRTDPLRHLTNDGIGPFFWKISVILSPQRICRGCDLRIRSVDLRSRIDEKHAAEFERIFPKDGQLDDKTLRKLFESNIPLARLLIGEISDQKCRLVAILQEEVWRMRGELHKIRHSGHRPPENLDRQVSAIDNAISGLLRDASEIIFGTIQYLPPRR